MQCLGILHPIKCKLNTINLLNRFRSAKVDFVTAENIKCKMDGG